MGDPAPENVRIVENWYEEFRGRGQNEPHKQNDIERFLRQMFRDGLPTS